MNNYMKLVAGGGLGAAVILASSGAVAAPIVDNWDFTLNNAFFDAVPGSVVASGSNPEIGGSTRIEWPVGSSGARSALEIEHDSAGVVGGTVPTNGGNVAGAEQLHINTPIPTSREADFLVSVRLRVQGTLMPSDPAIGGSVGPFETFFDFVFEDTANAVPCGFDSQTTCDDIFLLVAAGQSSRDFMFLDEAYALTIGSEQLATLSDAQCAEVGEEAGCTGFLTQENGTTAFDTFLSVTGPDAATPVSEPGTIAMLGAGLVALGVTLRRRTPRRSL